MFVSGLFHFVLIRRSTAAASSSSGAGIPAAAGSFFAGPNIGEVEGIDDLGRVHGRRETGNKVTVIRKGAWRDVWLGGGVLGEALSGFVLGWAGVGGVLR